MTVAGRVAKVWWELTPFGRLGRMGGPPGVAGAAVGVVCAALFAAQGMTAPALMSLAFGAVLGAGDFVLQRRRLRHREERRQRNREDFLRRAALSPDDAPGEPLRTSEA